MKKKVCVIGASGVVGSHVVQCALRKGYKVRFYKVFQYFYLIKVFGECMVEASVEAFLQNVKIR